MRVIFILLLGLIPNLVFSSELSTLASRVETVIQDKTRLRDTLEQGKERTALCEYCHGADGISSRPYIPNLAGQHPVYLLRQMLHFSVGKRQSQVMEPLAKKMTQDDMINIAIYYAKMSVPTGKYKTQTYDAQAVEAGRDIYNTQCARCHGSSGQGSGMFPRLGGQKIKYVIDTLKMFAAPETEKNNPLLFNAARSNPEMVNIVRKLKPDDMRAVANYIATLQ